jgi:hypothetical protein
MKRYEEELNKLKLAYQMVLYFRVPIHPGIAAKLIDVIDATYSSNYGIAIDDMNECRAHIYYSLFVTYQWLPIHHGSLEPKMLMGQKRYKDFVAFAEEYLPTIPEIQDFAQKSIQPT